MIHILAAGTSRTAAKGVGEAGTVGSMPAIMNAVNDALHRIGAPQVEMPATAEKGWRAVQERRGI